MEYLGHLPTTVSEEAPLSHPMVDSPLGPHGMNGRRVSSKEPKPGKEGQESVTGRPSNRQHNPWQTRNQQDLKLLTNVAQLGNGQGTPISGSPVRVKGVLGACHPITQRNPSHSLRFPHDYHPQNQVKFAQTEYCWRKSSKGREGAVEYLWIMRGKDEMGPQICWKNRKLGGCAELNTKTVVRDPRTNFIIY